MTADGRLALIVDDDEQVGRAVARILEAEGFQSLIAGTFADGAAVAETERPDLAVVDIGLPDRSGIDLARLLRSRSERVALLIQSGNDDPRAAELAVEVGAMGYLVKPFARNEFLIAVCNVLARRDSELRARRHATQLEDAVATRTAQLERTVGELELSRAETIRRLARAVEMRDPTTGQHIERIGPAAARLAEAAGESEETAESIRVAAPLHDVGKIAIPDRILMKPGPLTDEERLEMERHAEIGYEILSGSGSSLLELAATIALTHHEHVDGGGYPRGLKGEEIPLAGRIVAIVDVFDALVSDRPYRAAMSFEAAMEILGEGHSSQFDPDLLDLFLDRIDPSEAVPLARGRGLTLN